MKYPKKVETVLKNLQKHYDCPCCGRKGDVRFDEKSLDPKYENYVFLCNGCGLITLCKK